MSHQPSHEDLAALWELSGELLSITGTDGVFLEVNDAWPRVLGWSRSELTTRPFSEFVHPDDLERTLDELGRINAPGSKVEGFVNRYRHADGTYRWLSWTARTDDSGQRIYSVTRDVTDSVRHQMALRESETRFRLAMHSAPIGMGLVGLDRRFYEANDALLDLFGYSIDELRQLTVAELTHPDDRELSAHDFRLLSSGEVERVVHEKRYLTKDGEILWALLSAAAITGDAGEPAMYIAQIVDLSDRKRAERDREVLLAELEHQNAELESFAGAASHDLSSPILTMLGFLDLAADGKLPEEEQLLIDRARTIGHRALDTVRSLLRLSRLGSAELSLAPVDVPPIIAEVRELVVADDEHATVEVEGEIPRVQADRGALSVLLQNVIGNAVKFRREGEPARVCVSGGRCGDDVELRVDDAGPGVAPEDRDRIFAPFTRTERGRAHGGAGLGLATCARIVKRHGGSIRVDDSPLGGARFVVTLPAAYASQTSD